MFDRWRPTGARAIVIRVDHPDPVETIVRVRKYLPTVL
jgi:hypothetical protein